MANYIKSTAIQENSISETKLDNALQSWKETVTNHINNNDNPHNITKSSIGLDNVTNDAQVKRSELGVANGVATLDSTGKVPSGQLPSYVDDVIEGYLYNGVFYKDTSYTTSIIGESGKIYIDLPTNKTYRWTGSVYGVISETIALGELSSTAYRGDRGKIAYDHSQSAHAPSNAQANVIETIKVNGTALTPNSKAVDITIPTVGNGTITIKQGGTSKGTFTTNQNGNTTIELTDTNTTYTAGDGLSLSGTTFSNNGVRSIATGTTNGTISVNTNGNISNIGVYGLKSAAYTNSSDYATASHTHSYLPLSGGTLTGGSGVYTPLAIKSNSLPEVWIQFQDINGTTHIGSANGVPCINSGGSNKTILHSGNFNSYAPKLDGTGASGTWGINISGNAATVGGITGALIAVTNVSTGYWGELGYGSTSKLSIGTNHGGIAWRAQDYCADLMFGCGLDTHGFISVGYASPIVSFAGSNNSNASNDNPKWYFKLKGTTGTTYDLNGAPMATKLQNSRTIWGHNFDGTENVKGALSGVTTINSTLYIDLSGNIGIGTASPSYKLYVDGDGYFVDNVITESDFSSRGDAIIDGTVSCTKLLQTSDIKYKTNIKQIEYEEALKIIENLNPVTWDWNENTKISGSSSGFIAQEVKDIIPNAVSEDDENTLSLDYTQLHSYEIKVIQEQQKEIKDLKQRLEVLENLVLQLTNREI